MAKEISIEQLSALIKSGDSVMVGGFLGVGTPLKCVDYLANQSISNLTLMSVVGSYPGGGFDIGKLTANGQVSKFIGAHIGTDPALVKGYNEKTIDVEFNPMGTFIERVRAGGAGLGAVVTPVGVGTEVEAIAEKMTLFGKENLVFAPLHARVALVKAVVADTFGNLKYDGTSINTNPTMATAADIVIAEVDDIVEVGEIDPNDVGTPGILVDYIIKGYSEAERKSIFGEIWTKGNKLSK